MQQRFDSENRYIKQGAPRYKLLEPAYIDDVMYPEGAEINYAGVPGYFMEPVDDAARAMKKKHPSSYIDPIAELQSIGNHADPQMAALGTVIAQAVVQAQAAQANK